MIHVAGFNLGLVMRSLFGVGTARGLQGLCGRVLAFILAFWAVLRRDSVAEEASSRDWRDWMPLRVVGALNPADIAESLFHHGLLGDRGKRPQTGAPGLVRARFAFGGFRDGPAAKQG